MVEQGINLSDPDSLDSYASEIVRRGSGTERVFLHHAKLALRLAGALRLSRIISGLNNEDDFLKLEAEKQGIKNITIYEQILNTPEFRSSKDNGNSSHP